MPAALPPHNGWTPQTLQWAARGYLTLCGGLLLLPLLYFALLFTAHTPVHILLLTACTFIPIFHGMTAIRPPHLSASHTLAQFFALALAFLTPFLAFWAAHPGVGLFRLNLLLHDLAGLGWLVALHVAVRAQAIDVGDARMRIETTTSLLLMGVLPLMVGGTLAWLLFREGMALPRGLSFHPAIASMPFPVQVTLLFISLPYLITLFMLVQASNHAFRRALSL